MLEIKRDCAKDRDRERLLEIDREGVCARVRDGLPVNCMSC